MNDILLTRNYHDMMKIISMSIGLFGECA